MNLFKLINTTKSIRLLALTALLVYTVSCKKFLSEEPRYLLTEAATVYNEPTAESILNGAYSKIGKDEWTVRFSGGFTSMLGTMNVLSSAYTFSMGATSDNQNLWNAFYATVNAANAAINSISALPDAVFKNVTRKKEMLGEAHTIRAFTNLYIFWYFGRWWDKPESPHGLLFRDQPADLTNVYQARLNVKESYDKIIADLDYAIENAPSYKSPRRASKQLAQAMKAKLLLNRGWTDDYQTALKLVELVMNTAQASGIILEPSLTSLYDKSWHSYELLFCRYRETTDNVISAYNYTYGYNYANTDITALGESLLTGDPRYNMAWGMVRPPTGTVDKWRCKKLCRKGRTLGGDNDKYTTYFLRYTELYLMRAELIVKTGGSIDNAMVYINQIRGRSGLGALSAANSGAFYTILFSELFKELHMENDADWMAALRIKDAANTSLLYNLRGTTVTIEEDKLIFPIPTSEMKYNHLMKQNPGYESLVY